MKRLVFRLCRLSNDANRTMLISGSHAPNYAFSDLSVTTTSPFLFLRFALNEPTFIHRSDKVSFSLQCLACGTSKHSGSIKFTTAHSLLASCCLHCNEYNLQHSLHLSYITSDFSLLTSFQWEDSLMAYGIIYSWRLVTLENCIFWNRASCAIMASRKIRLSYSSLQKFCYWRCHNRPSAVSNWFYSSSICVPGALLVISNPKQV